MSRLSASLAARLAVLLLSSAALCACSSVFGDTQTPAGQQAAAPAASNTMADNLDAAIQNAQQLRRSGDYDGAIRVLSQLMLVAADDPRVVSEYGKTLVQQGRAAEGKEFLKRAVELKPSDWTLYSALGVACDETGDVANARIAYEHALALKPGEAVVLNNYAMSRMLADDPVGAKKLIDEAAATGAADPQIARNLTYIDAHLPKPQSALSEPVAAAQPLQAKPVAKVATASLPSAHAEAASPKTAEHAPRPLSATLASGPYASGVVMEKVPYDPKAGPVKQAAKAQHAPHHLAAAHSKHPALPTLRPADHAVKDAKAEKPEHKAVASGKIPALRLAADQH